MILGINKIIVTLLTVSMLTLHIYQVSMHIAIDNLKEAK